jgi:hypothetical protein
VADAQGVLSQIDRYDVADASGTPANLWRVVDLTIAANGIVTAVGIQAFHSVTTTTVGDQTLPVATLTVASTAGFRPNGIVKVEGQFVVYTGLTATSFTGCAGGTGPVPAGATVTEFDQELIEL